LLIAHIIGFCMLAVCSPFSVMAQMDPASQTKDQDAIPKTIASALAALGKEDAQAFDSYLTPDFYMYDVGARYDAAGIMDRIKQAHASGTRIEWRVTKPDVHVYGKTAWIAYVNDGSISNANGTMPMKWLESAFLVNTSGAWKVVFWHSTRVAPQTPAAGSTTPQH